MVNSIFPNDKMIDDLDASLKESKFSYLPKSQTSGKYETVEELDSVVQSTAKHLKDNLIPKLKQMQASVQKRNRWLECQDRNKHQIAVFEAENDMVHNLIIKEKNLAREGFEAVNKYP